MIYRFLRRAGAGYWILNKHITRKGAFIQRSFLSSLGSCLCVLACYSLQLYRQAPANAWDNTIGGRRQRLKGDDVLDLTTLPTQRRIRPNPDHWQEERRMIGLHAQAVASSSAVVPIDWSKFTKGMPQDEMGVLWRTAIRNSTLFILTNSCFSCSQNMKAKFRAYKAHPNTVFTFLDADSSKGDENRIRPPASFIATLAIALQTGAYSEQKTGIPRADAAGFARCLINSVALMHEANGGYWGHDWQSSLWCSMTGLGGWLLWDSLEATTRERVRRMVESEANRFLLINPPVWNGSCCDTKAEENAWDATSVELAASMMPNHPNRQRWVKKAIQYRMTQAARKSDLANPTIYHGRAVKDWVTGYNLFEDGSVVNHGINPHPDYMAAPPISSAYGTFFYSLGGFPTPKANQFNFDIIYKCFVDKSWSMPPCATPGGTIYSSDTTIYWPPANVVGGGELTRRDYYYKWAAMDGFAHMLGYDKAASKKGNYWEPIHGYRLLKHMAQPGGQPGASHENNNEWAAIQVIGNAYFMHWLYYQGAVKVMDFNPDPPSLGLTAEYFDWTSPLAALPNLAGKVADVQRIEPQINYASTNHAWAGLDYTQFKDTYVARYEGYVKIVTAGSYTFYVNSDDGSQLWVDGTLRINNNGNHTMAEKSGTVTLTAGDHPIRLAYYENTGGAGLVFSWQGPGITKQVVPASALFNQSAAFNQTAAERCSASGKLLRELWSNVSGSGLSGVPLNMPPTLTDELTSLRTAANAGDNYGQRIRGYLCAPASGNYTFFIQGDDQAELWLSSDNNPIHKQRIAWASLAWAWTENPSQQSAPVSLVAGKNYYVEVLHKEGSGGDVLRVGWRTPDMATSSDPLIIPGSVLSPFIPPGNARQRVPEGSAPETLPDELTAWPNPFWQYTTISFTTTRTEKAQLEVCDLQGRLVAELFEGLSQAGEVHHLNFDGSRLSQGMYLVRLSTTRKVSYQKIILNK